MKLKYSIVLIILLIVFSTTIDSYSLINTYKYLMKTKDKTSNITFNTDTTTFNKSIDTSLNTIKIGVYENEPYYFIDSDGNVSGYYHDLLTIINERLNLNYEYVICDLTDGLKMLENNEIDIMFGLAVTDERNNNNILFNKYRVAVESHSLLTNLDIPSDDINEINNLRLGLIEDGVNSSCILTFLKSQKVDVIPIYKKTFNELEELLNEGAIDVMIGPNIDSTPYKKIYNFVGHQAYISSNNTGLPILNKFDTELENIIVASKLRKLYKDYFFTNNNYNLAGSVLILVFLNTILIGLIILFILPRIKLRNNTKKIKTNLVNNFYFLKYQPIYNPRNNTIIGFEGLLRLKDKNNNVIPPYKFIHEIEKNNMLFDVSLWVLNRAIEDYKKIESLNCIDNKNFYISINVSLDEIENKKFIKKAIEILANSNLGPNKICLEIIERVKINNLNNLNKYIKALKNAGFKIAIDDFGVEYSNLDIIRKIDFDIIKVDKSFVDDICKDTLQKEIILFINNIANYGNKTLILEGIEDTHQHDLIKTINNEKLYVQRYFYSMPMDIDEIEHKLKTTQKYIIK